LAKKDKHNINGVAPRAFKNAARTIILLQIIVSFAALFTLMNKEAKVVS